MGTWVFPRRLIVAGVTAALLFQAGAIAPARVSADPPVTRTGGTFAIFGSGNSGSTAFTLPADSNWLVAMISLGSAAVSVTSMRWKPDAADPGQDQPMVFVGRQVANGNVGAVEIWMRAHPTPSVSGSSVDHALSGSTTRLIGIHALAGVGTYGSPVGAAAFGISIGVTVPSEPGALVFDVLYGQNSTTSYTPGAGQIERWDANFGNRGAGSEEAGGTSVGMTWTIGQSTNLGLLGVSFNPTPAVPPSAPTLTSAFPGQSSVPLTWTAPSSDGGSPLTGYQIWRGTSSGGESLLTTVGVQTSYTDTTAVNGTTYYYQVAAVNFAGGGARSNELSVTPHAQQPPDPPTLNSATPGNGNVALTWTPPYDNGGSPITGYEVWRGTSPGSTSLFATTGNVTN
ncbi:MAG: fibronectin type III domain-containing protein, partial [bacterium]